MCRFHLFFKKNMVGRPCVRPCPHRLLFIFLSHSSLSSLSPCNFPTAPGSHHSTLCFPVCVCVGGVICDVWMSIHMCAVCGEARAGTWVFFSVFLCLVDFRQGFSLSQSWFWLDQSGWWVLRVCWSLFLDPSSMPCFECSFTCLQKSLTTKLALPFRSKKLS